MDSRQSLSRTPSSIQQGPYNANMSSAYPMPYQQHQQPHLPPIQSHHQQYQQPNHNYLQQPYRPDLNRYQSVPSPLHTPDRYNTPSHMGPQSSIGGGLPPATLLPQPGHQYQGSQNYTPTSSASQGYPTRIAPAPPRSDMAPLSANYNPADNRPPMWTSAEGGSNIPAESPRDDTRTHVVGSQGRRGILPSAPGRATVAPDGINGSPKNAAIPAKDADGKFPCPNCNKTYLHAKHLKRHMLRHTGDRPYMCVLCRDTFSRSDILKRHFQKCSVRRGNPAGLSHLSSPAAHLKKSQAAAAKSGADPGSAASTPTTSNMVNGGFPSTAMGSDNMSSGSANFSGPPSMSYNMATAAPNTLQRPTSDQSYPQGSQPNVGQNGSSSWSMQNAKPNPMLYQSNPASPDHFGMAPNNHDQKRDVMSGGHAPGEDWIFQPGANDNYMQPIFSNMGPNYEHAHNGVKNEHHDGNSSEYYIPPTSLGADGTLGPPIWNLDISQDDPLQTKVGRLIDFCFPGGIQDSLQDQQNKLQAQSCLTVDNIKHFLDLFTNFQGHFPYLHIPTSNIIDSYDGLLIAIICVGAVYSDRLSQNFIRDLMQRTKLGIERTSSIFRDSAPDIRFKRGSPSAAELQELQALLLLQAIFTWHGGPVERALARAESQKLFNLMRQYGMLELAPPGHEAYSYLHNVTDESPVDLSQWSWQSWVEQEKRSRVMYLVFLLDTALTMWFNCPPQFDPSEIRLPLPCDDAAWEARSPEGCARALGLHGREAQLALNTTGSLRINQMAMPDAMSIVYNTSFMIQPRTTNVYSKFALIHALHIQTWQIQRQRSTTSSAPQSPIDTTSASSTASPGSSFQSNSSLRAINAALVRWKKMWDEDMQLQYPPNTTALASRRSGFCRDGVHFYWLARTFLQPNRVLDWQLPADVKFKHVFKGLRQVREWSKSEGAQRGEEPGSVSDIDDRYGSETLQLDMTKLFRPLGEVYDSASQGTSGSY